jgi:hypothetical protein
VIGPWRPHISILQNGPSENRTLLMEQFRCQKLTTFRVPIGFSRSTVKAHVVVRSERQTLNANTLEELPGCAVNLLPVQSPFVFLRAEIRGAAGAQHTTRARWPRCIEAYHHDIGQRHAGLVDGVLKTAGRSAGGRRPAPLSTTPDTRTALQ